VSAVPIALLYQLSRILPFALFLAAWQGVAKSGFIDPTFLPSVGAVANALIDLGEAWVDWRSAPSSAFRWGRAWPSRARSTDFLGRW
jgi:ABC-type nitrate/sulfonate/bicarbonate transport system permease component